LRGGTAVAALAIMGLGGSTAIDGIAGSAEELWLLIFSSAVRRWS